MIIWTPLSDSPATMAYIDEPIVTMAMPDAPASSSKVPPELPSPSVTVNTAVGDAGSVISIIWTALSLEAVTRAYVDESILTVTMSFAAASSKATPLPSRSPSFIENTAVGFLGSVISIIWMPLS